jgi:zinc/manganese transport system substrate-binding protein
MLLLRAFITAVFLIVSSHALAAPLKVVASFSVLADMVEQVAGPHAQVASLIGSNSDPHAFRPSPGSIRLLREADLVVVNGLGFEGWLTRALAEDETTQLCVASNGVNARHLDEDEADHDHGHDHGAEDPHAWLSLGNAQQYVDNIATALAQADPTHAADYRANATRYKAELSAIDAEARGSLESIPTDKRRALSDHAAFAYLGADYGIEFIALRGAGSDAEPSAKALAGLIREVRTAKVQALFVENLGDSRLLLQVAREAGVPIGGTLYAGALSPADGPAASYAQMMRHNLDQLAQALAD